ncbi:hypothetical protein ES703_119836 [subsurface metagenome]
MPAGEIFSVAGVIIIAIGLVATWIRNGRSQSKRDGALEQRIKGVEDKLSDDNNGLSAIKKSVDDQRVHCAGVTSSFTERIKNLEGD